ncbi:MAG: hypothetical protein WD009_02880 [Phycisphaeraceae bacterium]
MGEWRKHERSYRRARLGALFLVVASVLLALRDVVIGYESAVFLFIGIAHATLWLAVAWWAHARLRRIRLRGSRALHGA